MYRLVFLFVFLFPFSTISAQVSESLGSGALPAGWSATSVTFPSGYAKFSGSPSFLITPAMTLSVGATIQFEVAKFGSGGDTPLTVDISDDGGATWTAQTFTSPTPTSSTYVLSGPTSISVVGSNVKIRFSKASSGSQKRLRNVVITNALPIELISFEAYKNEGSVQLFWETASEKNNKEFIVERSSSIEGFSKIGTVDGAGTVESLQEYDYTDNNPILGINYYRLRQVDYNGTISFSDIRSVNITKKTTIALYPNPATDFIHILRSSKELDEEIYQIIDMQGRIVKTIQLMDGEQNKQIELFDLPAGMYYIRGVGMENGQIFMKN